MGFGLILMGYILANDVMKLSFVPSIIGYALMSWGCIKLNDYNVRFKRCAIPLIPSSILSIYLFCDRILKLDSPIFTDTAVKAVRAVEAVSYACFMALLMVAIVSIAKETGLDKLAFRAARNMVIIFISESIYLIATCLPTGNISGGMAYCAMMIRLLRVILDTLLLFACYRMICSEGDEDMPAKEIKTPILRKMEEVMNKRDKNTYDSAKAFKENRIKKKRKK